MSRYLRLAFLLFLIAGPTCRSEERALVDGPMLVRRVLTVLDARIALMPDVAAAKWVSGQPVGDPAREAAVIQAATDQAVALGLSRDPVQTLIAGQIARARAVQTAAMDRWGQDGSGPTSAPSLRDELRPRIDALSQELLTALYLAAPYFASLNVAALTATLPDARWSTADRQELEAALGAIRLDSPLSTERIRHSHVLRIGLPADYAPFAWTQDGLLTGADVELTAQLAHVLGLTPVYVRSTWATLMSDLAADRFDIAAGGISITASRQANALFTQPLVSGGKAAIGRCADRGRLSTLEAIDRPDVRVIENPGGTNEQFARRHLPHSVLTVHADNLGVFQELVAGRADVMITDDIEIARVTHHEPRLCRLTEGLYEPSEKAMLLPKNAEWRDAVTLALTPILENGAYRKLLEAASDQ